MTATTLWRHKQRERGLRRNCTQPVAEGKSMCAAHLAMHCEDVVKGKSLANAKGMCANCRKNPVTRFQKCLTCRQNDLMRKRAKHG